MNLFLLILLTVFNVNFASEKVRFISLGSHCGPTLLFKQYGVREAAYPFDWMLSIDGEKIIEILNDDFAYFLDEKYLLPHPTSGILLHHVYHLEFSHEENSFGASLYNFFDTLIPKFQRRIERFRQLNNFKGKVFFIRASFPLSNHRNYVFHNEENLMITEDYAYRLHTALYKRFPQLNFVLVIVNTLDNEVAEESRVLNKGLRMLNCSPKDEATSFAKLFEKLLLEETPTQ